MPECSLIISFYNKVDYLKLVLAGLERQSFKDFEIIIADDGSSSKAVSEIENLSSSVSFPLIHVWHPDKGFRKNKILNKAVVSSNTDYLIFIDGDCIPHREFIREHNQNKHSKFCLTGRRVNLSSKVTDSLNIETVRNGVLEKKFPMLLYDSIAGESKDVEKGWYIKNRFMRDLFNKKQRGLLGCNFSIHKEDFLLINGFDERYEAPSIGEDSDVQFRLELLGIKIKSLNLGAVQYHLYHKLQERPAKNLELFEKIKKERKAYTPFGIK